MGSGPSYSYCYGQKADSYWPLLPVKEMLMSNSEAEKILTVGIKKIIFSKILSFTSADKFWLGSLELQPVIRKLSSFITTSDWAVIITVVEFQTSRRGIFFHPTEMAQRKILPLLPKHKVDLLKFAEISTGSFPQWICLCRAGLSHWSHTMEQWICGSLGRNRCYTPTGYFETFKKGITCWLGKSTRNDAEPWS